MERLLNIFAAIACAYYATPVVVDFFEVGKLKWAAAIAALIGLIGMSIFSMALDILRSWAEQFRQYPIVDRLLAFLPKKG